MTRWWDHAACRGMPVDIFIPETRGGHGVYDAARPVCAACPVQAECLADAIADDRMAGMWGGTTPGDRRRIRQGVPAARREPPTPDPRCGSHAGYRAHERRGEEACEPCRAARAEVIRQWRRRRREDAA